MRDPSSRISPPAMRPGRSSSPMIAVPVIDYTETIAGCSTTVAAK